MDKELKIGSSVGKLNTFIIEPFVPHKQSDEYYVCIYATREGNTVLFHHEGGVDIGDVESKAGQIHIDIEDSFELKTALQLVNNVPEDRRE